MVWGGFRGALALALGSGIPEPARMPPRARPRNRLPRSFEVRFSGFHRVGAACFAVAMDSRHLPRCSSRHRNDAREFLAKLLEVNSTRVQSDILNRAQDSRGYLEIRKLLHEVGLIAEKALINAQKAREGGASAGPFMVLRRRPIFSGL